MVYFLGWLFLSVVSVSSVFANNTNCNFIAIAYHDVVWSSEQSNSDSVTRSDLVGHFQWLKENGYHPVSVSDILKAQAGEKPLPDKAILITFDDGYASFYTVVFPLLKAFNFPAVAAVVGSWIDAKEQHKTIAYGSEMISAENFMTWKEIKEVSDSGLVDIASHSFASHLGITANPQGTGQAALVTRFYDMQKGQYESFDTYKNRVQKDLATNNDHIFNKIGKRPRVIVWPYGRYNKICLGIAKSIGIKISITLDDEKYSNSTADLDAVGRCYYTPDETFSAYIMRLENSKKRNNAALRAVRIDLDKIYDPDPKKIEENLSRLIDRLYKYQISAVFIKAFSNTQENGHAESLYFHNRHLPIKSDIFNRICWQITTRVCWQLDTHSYTQVYAWLPMAAFDFKGGGSSGKSLSSRQKILEIYEDLAFNNSIAGIVLDDGMSSDLDNWSPAAIDFTKEIMQKAKVFRPALKVVRGFSYVPTSEPGSEAWFAQTLQSYFDAYDYVALMTMPSSSGLLELVDEVKKNPSGIKKTIFEIQTIDRSDNDVPLDSGVILKQMRSLSAQGVRHFSLYPDDFFNDQPEIAVVREGISLQEYPYLP